MPSREITWLERPYDMNGSVSPVVGIRPSDTAMCMNAVRPMVAVSPTARYWPNGSVAVRAMRKPSQQNRAKRDNHDADTDESPLLTDGAEEKIRVRVRKVPELLLAFSKADAEQLARANSDQRLMDLKAGFRRCVAGIEEGQHPGETILDVANLMKDQNHPPHRHQTEMADLGPRREQHESAEQRHQRGHREVRLQQDQERHQAENHDEGQDALLELADLSALLRRQHGAPDHHHQPGQL